VFRDYENHGYKTQPGNVNFDRGARRAAGYRGQFRHAQLRAHLPRDPELSGKTADQVQRFADTARLLASPPGPMVSTSPTTPLLPGKSLARNDLLPDKVAQNNRQSHHSRYQECPTGSDQIDSEGRKTKS
jgi:hypothetical protein